MGQSAGMTLPERQTALGMLTVEMTGSEGAARFGRSESTISCLWTKYSLSDRDCN